MKKLLAIFTSPVLLILVIITMAANIREMNKEVKENGLATDLRALLIGVINSEPIKSYLQAPAPAKFLLSAVFYLLMYKIIWG